MLPENIMPEAEVTLRLAFYLILKGYATNSVTVAIDGAQVKTGSTVHFPIIEFLKTNNWQRKSNTEKWQAEYFNPAYSASLSIHSLPGEGDLVAKLISGKTLRVESKKGPLFHSKNSQEYPLIREAIGQLMTFEHASSEDVLAVAVPHSEKFTSLASQWRSRPLMKLSKISIITVARSGEIYGLESFGI